MESETETINYKNTSMPPSARLEENRKKEPFSSVAAGSPSVVITGPCSLESAILRFPGWSEHPQTGSSRGSQGMGGPAPLWLSSQGTGPRAVLGDGPSHHKGGSVIRGTQGSAHSAPCWPLHPDQVRIAVNPPYIGIYVLPNRHREGETHPSRWRRSPRRNLGRPLQ